MIPVIYGIAGTTLSPDERAFFKDSDPAGYILFARNCETPEQLRALTDSLREIQGRERLFICIDQEGGRVARMKPPEWRSFPPGAVFDTLYDTAPISAIEAARSNAEALGLELHQMGISANCLPLLDVRQDGADEIIGDRALGAEPMRVAALGRAVLDGMARAGVVGIVKHIPGHGRASVDSHKELPIVTASETELETDIAPFAELADAPAGMTAHIRYTAWDDQNPATQSPVVIEDIIRGRIGFDGLLMSDDLDMEALDGTVPERGAKAVAAGCDIALNCWAKMPDMTGLASLLPEMSDKAKVRLERALTYAADTPEGEIAPLLAKRDALLAEGERA